MAQRSSALDHWQPCIPLLGVKPPPPHRVQQHFLADKWVQDQCLKSKSAHIGFGLDVTFRIPKEVDLRVYPHHLTESKFPFNEGGGK